jgi:O-antigen/teichoic acid export membrane protein
MVLGTGIARACGMVSTALVAKLLGPALFGVWGTVRLIYIYGTISHLGVLEAYRKESPRYRGAGREDAALEVENLSLGWAFASSGVPIALGTILLVVCRTSLPDSAVSAYAFPIFWMLWSVMGATLGTLFFDRFSVRHRFEQASILRGVRGFAYLLLIPLGTWLGGISGSCLGFALAEWAVTLVSVWLARGKCPPMHPRFDLAKILPLIGIGFPITLVWWVYMVGTTFDRVVTVSLLGTDAAGLYFLGVTLASVLQILPEALSRVVNPRLNEKMGESSDPSEVARLVWEPAKSLSWMLPLCFGVLVFFIGPLYGWLFKEYLPGVETAMIQVLAASLVALIPMGTDFLVAIHQQRKLLLVIPTSLGLNLLGNYTIVKMGFGIGGIATITLFTNGLVACYLWNRVGNHRPGSSGLGTVLSLLVGFVVCNGLVWPLEWGWVLSLSPGWGGAVVKAVLFAAAYLAVLGGLPLTREWMISDYRRLSGAALAALKGGG